MNFFGYLEVIGRIKEFRGFSENVRKVIILIVFVAEKLVVFGDIKFMQKKSNFLQNN